MRPEAAQRRRLQLDLHQHVQALSERQLDAETERGHVFEMEAATTGLTRGAGEGVL